MIKIKHRVVVALDLEVEMDNSFEVVDGKAIREIQDFVADRINLEKGLTQKGGIIKYVNTTKNEELIAVDKEGVEYLEKMYD